jgi:hypothetical protein
MGKSRSITATRCGACDWRLHVAMRFEAHVEKAESGQDRASQSQCDKMQWMGLAGRKYE